LVLVGWVPRRSLPPGHSIVTENIRVTKNKGQSRRRSAKRHVIERGEGFFRRSRVLHAEQKEGSFRFFSFFNSGCPSYDIKGAEVRQKRRDGTTQKAQLRQKRRKTA
jgi:hypothetical protein